MATDVEQETSSFWSFKGADEYIDSLFFMRCPFPMLIILGMYHLFVHKIGPAYMKNRPAYKLRKLLLFYNAFQVAFSVYLTSVGVRGIIDFGFLEKDCLSSNMSYFRRLTFGHYLYFIAKMTELLDTVFFVLRKKWNQVSFLHVYHHTLMYLAAWATLKYEPTYSLVFLGTLNSFVHTIMYSYYGLSAFPKLQKYLWWKKYITKMQLVQFLMIMIQIQLNTITSDCPASYILLSICYFHGLLFIYLFTDFYIKSYREKKKDNIAKNESEKDKQKFENLTSKVLKNEFDSKNR